MDLLLDASGDLVFINGVATVTVEEPDVVAQRLRITLYTFLGEWFRDATLGVPYFQQIFGKNRSKSTVDVIFQNIIKADPGVVEIKEFSSSLTATRGYSMTFTVRVNATQTTTITIDVGL